MATSIDAQSNAGDITGLRTTLTWSHTCASNARLYVMCSDFNAGTSSRITGVTYNGDALTVVDRAYPGGSCSSELWYIDLPDSGTHDIVITASTNIRMLGGATSFLGAATSSLGAYDKATAVNPATSVSKALTTTVDGSMIIASIAENNIKVLTATGTNQTLNFQIYQTDDGDSVGGSTQTTTTAGSYTNGFSYDVGPQTGLVVAEVKAAIAPSFVSPLPTYFRV